MIAGGTTSWTLTTNVLVDELPNGSDAMQLTGVAPMGKVVFGRGVQVTLVPGGLP